METIYFLTSNKNKFQEVKKLINSVSRLDLDLPEIQEIDAKKIIEAKLLEGLKQHKGPMIVEDTSFHLEALNGLPGPLIKWFIKSLGEEGLYKLAQKLGNTNAMASVVVGFAKNPGKIYYFEGRVKGDIVPPKGKGGFGWDVIFMPEGYSKTFAQMNMIQKNKISHRSRAILKLKEFLQNGPV